MSKNGLCITKLNVFVVQKANDSDENVLKKYGPH